MVASAPMQHIPPDAGPAATQSFSADLVAVIAAVTAGTPRILTVKGGRALPSGPFELGHRSLQSGLRDWVEKQTHHPLGHIEQLYTFADGDRVRTPGGQRVVSISYLGLTREGQAPGTVEARWCDWHGYLPWEDHRAGPPEIITRAIAPALRGWSAAADSPAARWRRAAAAFGLDGHAWDEELALQRYELLYEAGLVPEARPAPAGLGQPMLLDHRRILATAVARLRAKIKYHPVIFELMPPEFTLLQLQRGVEGIAGRPLHKQNFRRLIEQQELVEETGATASGTAGRPAKLFRFRREVLAGRGAAGTKLPQA